MKTFTRTVLGAAIATLLVSPLSASSPSLPVRPMLNPPPAKGEAAPRPAPINQLIVKFRDDADLNPGQRQGVVGRIAASRDMQANIVRRMGIGADVVRLSRGLDPVELEAVMGQLRVDPSVEYVVADRMLQPLFTPNDPLYAPYQWHYNDPVGGLSLPAAWDLSRGAGTVVAVIDTGITSHPDLAANILPGYDFITNVTTANDGNGRDADPADPGDWVVVDECSPGSAASNSSWHGTHVAGTVAAVTNNGSGVAGVAHLGKVVPIRVLGKCGGSTSDIADAITWASGGTVPGAPANPNPAEVINMSLGGQSTCDAASQAAINGAVALGSVVVVAAGNSNSSVENFTPASCNNVVSVASNDQNAVRSGFSNSGGPIDVSAGGGDPGIASTLNDGTTVPGAGNYVLYQGTSMAAPHVAGVVAMMQSADPHTPAEVEAMLKLTATPMTGALCPGLCGAGRVNALRALNATLGTVYSPKPGLLRAGIVQLVGSSPVNMNYRYTLPTFSDSTGLTFSLTGSGNADLYVKFNAKPTTTDYDCRSIGGTSAETCVIPVSQVGSYHVLVRAKAAFSNVNLTGTFNSRFFTNKSDLPIRDATGANTDSPIFVFGRAGNAPSNLRVSVRIYHTFIGDLDVELVAPDGTVYVLSDNAGGAADVLDTDYFVDASSEVANGTWKLRARDGFNEDAGHIDQVTLRF